MGNKSFLTISFLLCGIMLLFSCKKSNTATPYVNYGNYVFAGTASASQIVPTNPLDSSTGTATFDGVYDSTLQILNYTISWTGLTNKVTAMNFYAGADSGMVAPLARNIATYNSTTYLPATYTYKSAYWNYNRLSGEEFNKLKNDLWYFVINTTNFSGGEVRGQIRLVRMFK